MRNEGTSEGAVMGRGATTPDRLGRPGLHDRTNLRASPDSAQGVGPIYWHSELPPFEAEAIGEHVVEATSLRVPGTLAHRDELWDRCYEDLMTQARARLEQEIIRATTRTCSLRPPTAGMTAPPARAGCRAHPYQYAHEGNPY